MSTHLIYQIKIKGHLDLSWSEWLEGLAITHQPGGESLLIGPVVDQPALYGLLLKLRDLNLTLLSLQRLEPASASDIASEDDLITETQ